MPPRIEEYETLTDLMRRWNELEPWRCDGSFVRIYSETEHGMHCADEYGDDTVAGKWDRQKIAMAVRVACEAKGWILRVQDWPATGGSPRNTHASVQRYMDEKDFQGHPKTEMRHGDGRCRTAAIVEAYVEMLSDYPQEADAQD